MIEFPSISTPMSCRRVKVMSTLFLWFSLCFQEDEYDEGRRVEEIEVQHQISPQVDEVEEVPQGDQVPNVGGGDEPSELSNRDICKT